MPFVAINTKRLSDLIVDEFTSPSAGYTRQDINVTPPAGGGKLSLGQVVYRVKSLDPTAAYAVVSAAAQLVSTNEFAVVFGDGYSENPDFVPNAIAAGAFNAVGVNRGPIILKEFYIKKLALAASLTEANFVTLKELLKLQGVIVELTV